jgi:nucleotide-binding universal stress UspA family protein
MRGVRHILCPVDFFPASEAALRYAVALAERLDAALTVLHVVHIPAYAMPDGSLTPPLEWMQPVLDAAERELAVLVERTPHANVVLDRKVAEGMPHRAINEHAAACGADLIVMGTHGRSGLTHLLLGSVAERVVRTATTPVLTIRAAA